MLFKHDAELVIALVGRIGVNTKSVRNWVTEALHALHYRSTTIKITDYLKEKSFTDIELNEDTVEDRYSSYIAACNSIRSKTGCNDFFATYAIQKIIGERENLSDDPDSSVPAKRAAYIIDQLKRPEEADALRSVYGHQFILISCHMTLDQRLDQLARKIAEGHSSAPKAAEWQGIASKLIRQDEKEAGVKFGQRVSDVFPKADVIIDASDENASRLLLERFFGALFGNFRVSPTRGEFFQNIASNVALTSCDTARQVGAAISRKGDILSTGFNEAPKQGGGTYWSGENSDARDVTLGKDVNTVRKRQMVTDLVKLLRDNQYLADSSIEDHLLEAEFLDKEDAPLKGSQIMDTLEYGRAVHAEMAALSTASRLGLATQDAELHCTTFPCHNCAKHIVASGISKVYYLEPYGKSFADELYPDSISIDKSVNPKNSVVFSQFIGITPNRYAQLFGKEKLKDSRGNVIEWKKESCQPVFGQLGQSHIDREIIFQKGMNDQFDPELRVYLGFQESAD